jgi:hypothetical protein
MQTIEQVNPARQESGLETESSPLDSLIHDLSDFRDRGLSRDRRRRSAILAGQMAILARQYKTGRPPSRRTLKGFFYLVARELAA